MIVTLELFFVHIYLYNVRLEIKREHLNVFNFNEIPFAAFPPFLSAVGSQHACMMATTT